MEAIGSLQDQLVERLCDELRNSSSTESIDEVTHARARACALWDSSRTARVHYVRRNSVAHHPLSTPCSTVDHVLLPWQHILPQ